MQRRRGGGGERQRGGGDEGAPGREVVHGDERVCALPDPADGGDGAGGAEDAEEGDGDGGEALRGCRVGGVVVVVACGV